MWRPKEGWAHQRSEYFEANQPVKPYHKTRQKDYETGADAILEGLLRKASAYKIKAGESLGDEKTGARTIVKVNGTVVFIPDEEV